MTCLRARGWGWATSRPRGALCLALAAGAGMVGGSSCVLPAYEATLETGGAGTGASGGGTGGGGTGGGGAGGDGTTATMGGGGTGGTTTSGGGGTGGCRDRDPAIVWSHTYGDGASQIARALTVDAAGGVVVVGSMAGAVDFGGGVLTSGGAEDGFIVRLDSSGAHDWSARFGDGGAQRFTAVTPRDAAVFMVGGDFTGAIDTLDSVGAQDAFVGEIEAAGTGLTTTGGVSGSTQSVRSVLVDTSGDVVALGEYEGEIDFGQLTSGMGGTDVFVSRFSLSGAHQWTASIVGSGAQLAAGMAIDTSMTPNDLIVAGSFVGGTQVNATSLTTSSEGMDVAVVRLDGASGALESFAVVAGAGDQTARGVATVPNGDILVAGDFTGEIDFGGQQVTASGRDIFLARLSSAGMPLALHTFGGPGDQIVESLAVNIDGDMLLAGRFDGEVLFDQSLVSDGASEDAFVVMLGADGAPQWSRAFGGSSGQAALAATFAGNGEYAVAGHFSGELDLGGCPVPSAGADDAFVLLLKP